MAQTKKGAIKIASRYYGLSVDEFKRKLRTENYCNGCRRWKLKNNFIIDRSRITGLNKKCHECRWRNGGKRGNFIKGRPSSMKGRHFTGKALINIRNGARRGAKKRIGKKRIYTKEGYANLVRTARLPKPHMRGVNSPAWKGGTTAKKGKDYFSSEYRMWRRAVFERDNYTCQECNDKKGGNLQAHHIKEYAKYPQLRYEISNGKTLCKTCHEKVHFNPNSTRNVKKKNKGIPLKY